MARGPLLTPSKRAFDIGLALLFGGLLLVPFTIVLVGLLLLHGQPLFHVAERMKAPGQPFRLWKLRTMPVSMAAGGVSGGDKLARVGPVGRFLRQSRLDEVPQLWNVLRGDMSFVGPRPPLRAYVERFPALYVDVLKSRPGLTGLATLRMHGYEERVLAACRNAVETDATYVRRCVPKKARLDLIYQQHRSLCLDLFLIWETGTRIFLHRIFVPKP